MQHDMRLHLKHGMHTATDSTAHTTASTATADVRRAPDPVGMGL